MVDVATMRELDPEQFSQAADGYHAVGNMADEAKGKVSDYIIRRMNESLNGEAADAARSALRGLGDNFHYMQTECGLIRAALNALTAELRSAKKKFDAAEEEAQTAGFTVHTDGSVSYPAAGDEVDGQQPAGGTVTGDTKGSPTGKPLDPTATANSTATALERQAANVSPNPNYGKAVDIANRIAESLKEATEADQKWAPKLRGLKADDDLHVSRKDWLDVKKDMRSVRQGANDYLKPPKRGSPEANATWWKSLTEEERDDYVALHPASIGAMDGLPAEARDEANRTVLAETKAQYRIEKASIPPEPQRYESNPNGSYPVAVDSEAWKKWNEKYGDKQKHLTGALKGMAAIEKRFEESGSKGLPPAYLLGFSGEDNGHAIIANGNPDTADHTAVYVPGTGAKLGSIGGDISRMTQLWTAADKAAPGQSVSTVTWLGYDAPQSVIPDATHTSWAEDGAPRLNEYLDGQEAAQGGPDASHTTVIGHSYGSTLVGQASRSGDLAADDIVAVGSPGMLVPHADDLDTGKDHVWSEGAGIDQGLSGFDYVPPGGKAANLGGWALEVKTFHGFPIGVVYQQNVPSDNEFGAKRMTVDTGGHSGYWNEGSQSLKNQAAVVAGKYGRVKLG